MWGGLARCQFLSCDFCSRAWFPEVFSFVWDTLFSFFLSPLVWLCPLPVFQNICNFPFLQAFGFFLHLTVQLTSDICLYQLFLLDMTRFSMANSIPVSWLYIFIVCIRVSNLFRIGDSDTNNKIIQPGKRNGISCKQFDVVVTVYFHLNTKWKAQDPMVLWGGQVSGLAITKLSKGP